MGGLFVENCPLSFVNPLSVHMQLYRSHHPWSHIPTDPPMPHVEITPTGSWYCPPLFRLLKMLADLNLNCIRTFDFSVVFSSTSSNRFDTGVSTGGKCWHKLKTAQRVLQDATIVSSFTETICHRTVILLVQQRPVIKPRDGSTSIPAGFIHRFCFNSVIVSSSNVSFFQIIVWWTT